MRWILVCALLGGCSHTHTQVDVGSATPQGGLRVHFEGGGRTLAALIGLSILAAGAYQAESAADEVTNAAPPLEPQRRVSEQDCTRPIDHSLGNLRCK